MENIIFQNVLTEKSRKKNLAFDKLVKWKNINPISELFIKNSSLPTTITFPSQTKHQVNDGISLLKTHEKKKQI